MDRLIAKRVIDDATGCWLYKGYRGVVGIRMITDDEGRKQKTSRVAYRLFHGDIPDGHFVCHRCDQPCCFNPDHLFLGTPADNSADMLGKERQAQGPRVYGTKLNAEAVRAIRRDDRPSRAVAADYGVHPTLIQQIRNGRIWKHVA